MLMTFYSNLSKKHRDAYFNAVYFSDFLQQGSFTVIGTQVSHRQASIIITLIHNFRCKILKSNVNFLGKTPGENVASNIIFPCRDITGTNLFHLFHL